MYSVYVRVACVCVCACVRVRVCVCTCLCYSSCRPYSASCVSVTEENSRDVPQGGADEGGEEEVEVDVETAEVAGG